MSSGNSASANNPSGQSPSGHRADNEVLNSSNPPAIRSRVRARFATLEWLESRKLMSVSPAGSSTDIVPTGSLLGSLTVASATRADVATVSMSTQGFGPTDITYMGQKYVSSTVLANSIYQNMSFAVQNLDGTGAMTRYLKVYNLPSTYDPRSRVLVQDGGWVKLTWQIVNTDNKVTWNLTVTNTSSNLVITGYNVFPTYLNFATTNPTYPEGALTNGVDARVGIRINDGNKSLLIVNESHDKSRLVQVSTADNTNRQWIRIGTTAYNGNSNNIPSQPVVVLQPGQSDNVVVSLRFIPQTTATATAAPDQIPAIRNAMPFTLQWSDRRPITWLQTADGNPNGSPLVTVPTNQADWPAYKARSMAWAQQQAASFKSANLQGVIVWDVEGPDQYKKGYAYAGDPRILPQTNPALDSFADEWFKVFRDAGLRVGVTIRPTTLVPKAGGGYNRVPDVDPVQSYVDKITYARDRWGCTLFYIDCADANSTTVLNEVHKRLPDVLLIPELTFGAQTGYQAFTAPYRDGALFTKTPSTVKDLYPDAFSVICTPHIPNLTAARNDLISAVRGGDILLINMQNASFISGVIRDANVPLSRTTTTGTNTSTGSIVAPASISTASVSAPTTSQVPTTSVAPTQQPSSTLTKSTTSSLSATSTVIAPPSVLSSVVWRGSSTGSIFSGTLLSEWLRNAA